MTSGNPLKISLVLATYNRADVLDGFLSKLQAQTLPVEEWEVLICNDGSKDHTADILDKWKKKGAFNLTYFNEKNRGAAGARDHAIRNAKADRVIVTDDDMILCDGYIEHHLKALGDQKSNVVIGKIAPRPDWLEFYPLYELVREYFLYTHHGMLERKEIETSATFFLTANVSFWRDFYVEVGGFDRDFRLLEDAELGVRLERNGGRFIFCPDVESVHNSNIASFDKWYQREYDYASYFYRRWLKYDRDIYLHPLRNLAQGSRLNRILVMTACPSDWIAKPLGHVIRYVGDAFKVCGAYKIGIAAYKALIALQYHRGLRDSYGGWKVLLEDLESMKSRSDLPTTPLGVGPTCKKD